MTQLNNFLKYKLLFIILFLFIFISYCNSQEEKIFIEYSTFSSSQELNQWLFAESLFKEKDYYRAIGEFKRYIFNYQESKILDKANFMIALCYFKADRLKDAILTFEKLIKIYSKSDLLYETYYKIGEAYFRLKYFEYAAETYKKILIESNNLKLNEKAQLMLFICYVRRKEWERGSKELNKLYNDFSQSTSINIYTNIETDLKKAKYISKKSPITATFMSAVLPGLGQIYSRRDADGLVAMLVNSIFIYNAIDGYQKGNQGRGNLNLFIGIPFYMGNLYNARKSAMEFNQKEDEKFILNVEDKLKDERLFLEIKFDEQGSFLIMEGEGWNEYKEQ